MKCVLHVDTDEAGSLSLAYKILNLLKGEGDAAAAVPPTSGAAPSPVAPPAAPAASSPPPAPGGVAPPAPPAAPSAPPASPSSPPPAPAPAAPPAPPAAPAGSALRQQLAEASQAFAKAYTAKGAKARFQEMAAAFGQPTWATQSNIPEDQIPNVLPWFAVA